MLNISQKILATIIAQLDSAISYHAAWFDDVSKVLVCRTAPNKKDLMEDVHLHCKFGIWYYNDAHPRLRKNPAYIAIEPLHIKMHQCATKLLQQLQAGKNIQPEDYSNFSTATKQLNMQISALSDELTDISRRLDPLTGVYTRGGMLTSLSKDLEKVKRGKHHCCIIMLDVDDFKRINDQYGHPVGDEVLRNVGAFICNQVRPYDSAYRYGGEEFLIVLQDCDITASAQITERLRSQLCKLEIKNASESPLNISASFGIYELEADISVTESINRADKAMYAAKRKGKNCLVTWQETDTQ